MELLKVMLRGGPHTTDSEFWGGSTRSLVLLSWRGCVRLVLKCGGNCQQSNHCYRKESPLLGWGSGGVWSPQGLQAEGRSKLLIFLPASQLESPLLTPNRSNWQSRTGGHAVPIPTSQSVVWKFGAETQKLSSWESHTMETVLWAWERT